MLDEEYRPWLIEFNANPCLEISCSVLNRIITNLIENVWKVAIDPLFPPPPLVYIKIHFRVNGLKIKETSSPIIYMPTTDLN